MMLASVALRTSSGPSPQSGSEIPQPTSRARSRRDECRSTRARPAVWCRGSTLMENGTSRRRTTLGSTSSSVILRRTMDEAVTPPVYDAPDRSPSSMAAGRRAYAPDARRSERVRRACAAHEPSRPPPGSGRDFGSLRRVGCDRRRPVSDGQKSNYLRDSDSIETQRRGLPPPPKVSHGTLKPCLRR